MSGDGSTYFETRAADPAAAGAQAAQASEPMAASVAAGKIWLRGPFRFASICAAVPDRAWDLVARAWTCPATARHAQEVLGLFGERNLSETSLSALHRIADKVPEEYRSVDLPVPGEAVESWAHQRRAYWFARRCWDLGRPGVYLALDMGLGKTRVAVDLARTVPGVARALVLCPKAVVPTWPQQVERYGCGQVAVFAETKGTLAARAEKAAQFLAADAPSTDGTAGAQPTRKRLVVANYESIDLNSSAWAEWAEKAKWDLLVLDEVHRCKAPGGVRSRWVARLARKVPRRLALSGTPMPHSPLDVYAQYRALDPSVFGTSFQGFRSRYCVPDPFFPSKVKSWINQEELSALTATLMVQVKSGDVFDLPEAVHVERPVDLAPATRKVYDSMEADFLAWVEEAGEEANASNALARLIRLQQITGGFVRTESGKDRRIGTEKADALAELLDELGPDEPVVVFAIFHEDLEMIHGAARDLGRGSMELSGRRNSLAEWQAAGDQPGGPQVLAAQIQAGKEGVDLTRARRVVYFDAGWSLGDHEQSLARVRRPGQRSKTVWYYHLVARDTVDEQKYRALAEKKSVVEAVLGEAKARTRVRK